ncbi:mucoidy inhibitor MuiA family protein [Actinocrispum sp. NPDC049592]|uniref:mucoidy inhibitor MuiA family protein n=1 Tax=Actinocrispum sp. NPDC049592 TaxID=3154835 RepID=UPI00341F67C9
MTSGVRTEAPIVAVTVYPGQARVTRRTTVTLTQGQQRVTVGGLPLGLQQDSVRVSGRGAATVLGVDVTMQLHTQSPDDRVKELEDKIEALEGELAELADLTSVEDSHVELLNTLGRRMTGPLARALAAGTMETRKVAGLSGDLSYQLTKALGRKRELAEQRLRVQEEHDMHQRTLAAYHAQQVPDRKAVFVELDVREDGDVEVELSYVVYQAQWESTYDIRLTGEQLTLTWHAEITQSTGEDWPECELALSTARPAVTAQVPELDPWYLDRFQPMPVPAAMMDTAVAGYGAAAPPPAPKMAMPGAARSAQALTRAVHEVEHGAAAATYRPTRQVAVPSDGTAHRTTVTVIDLSASLDHVTAPVIGPEAYLRATAVNTSEHTLRPGKASVFHESEFVGTTSLQVWSPSEEVELNLGVDDRIRVERELVRRTAGKAIIGSTRRREAEYRIKIGNFGRRQTTVTVLDQIPVSRDDSIVVKEVTCKPNPDERTDLGELTWKLPLAAGASGEITVGFRVDVARGVEMIGWRE